MTRLWLPVRSALGYGPGMHRLRLLSASSTLALAGCGANGLAQAWQLDRVRILGVRATPAEPRPGDRVTFESLVYTPAETQLGGVLWFACLPEGGVLAKGQL